DRSRRTSRSSELIDAGTSARLPPTCPEQDRLVAQARAEMLRDQTDELIESTLLDRECATPERADRALARLDLGTSQRGQDVRLLCSLLAGGLPALGEAARTLDQPTRERLARRLFRRHVNELGQLADKLFELEVDTGPATLEAAKYNLRHGNEARALIQLRRAVAMLTVEPRFRNQDPTLVPRLALEALEARAQRAGGSNR
ncbi:MAG: hypothetical protein WKG01_36220, partial [Kofleriaceae bacterium]